MKGIRIKVCPNCGEKIKKVRKPTVPDVHYCKKDQVTWLIVPLRKNPTYEDARKHYDDENLYFE